MKNINLFKLEVLFLFLYIQWKLDFQVYYITKCWTDYIVFILIFHKNCTRHKKFLDKYCN